MIFTDFVGMIKMRPEMTPNIKSLKLNSFQDVLNSVKCISSYQNNRMLQKKCIIDTFLSRNEKLRVKPVQDLEKSIFRGMVIPSLRHMGLILGYGIIQASANGFLLSQDSSPIFPNIKSAVIIESGGFLFDDSSIFGKLSRPEFVNEFKEGSEIIIPPEDISSEKRKRWVNILKGADIAYRTDSVWRLRTEEIFDYYHRRDYLCSNSSIFSEILSKCYDSYKHKSPFVGINILRRSVAEFALRHYSLVITENTFDDCLRKLKQFSKEYGIDFGLPMNQQERAFKIGNKYYSTLRLYREEDND